MAANRPRRFGIVIGSVARGTSDQWSDFDYVRIGPALKKPRGTPAALARRISVINYSWRTFLKLYRAGSLFIHHILNEGILVEGNEHTWEILRARFKVSRSFPSELKKNRQALKHIIRSSEKHIEPIPFLAHTLKCLKNIAIFSLAEEGVYIFDKAQAIQAHFPAFPKRLIAAMLYAESILDREITHGPVADRAKLGKLAREIYSICRELPATK